MSIPVSIQHIHYNCHCYDDDDVFLFLKFFLLNFFRNELDELQARVEKSKWWSGDQSGKFDPEELREVRWLQEAIKSFGTALDSIW